MANKLENGRLRPLTVEEEAQRQVDIANHLARAEEEALDATRKESNQIRVNSLLDQVGDSLDVAAAVLEGLDALSSGLPLPANTVSAIEKVRSLNANHPRGNKP